MILFSCWWCFLTATFAIGLWLYAKNILVYILISMKPSMSSADIWKCTESKEQAKSQRLIGKKRMNEMDFQRLTACSMFDN